MDPYRRHRPRNPYNGGHDFGLLMIFFLTFVLFVGVVGVLTVGTAWSLPEMPQLVAVETRSSTLFGPSSGDRPAVFIGTPTPVAAAGSPAAAATRAAGTPTRTPTPARTPTAAATPTPNASPTATAQVTGTRLVVGNTDSVGAWLRRTPKMNDYLITMVDGTPLEVIGPDVEAEGRIWKNVRDPKGNSGFIPAEWTVPAD